MESNSRKGRRTLMNYNWERPKSKKEMFWERLKAKPKNQNLIITVIISMVIFGVIQIFIFQPTENYLRGLSNLQGLSNLGRLDLEFAWTEERINTIFSLWQSPGIFRQFVITIIDFFYLICYCLILAGLIFLVARKLHDEFQKVLFISALIPILAGIFDIFENIFLLIMLGANEAVLSIFPFITSISSTIKFVLIYIGVGFFLIGIIGILLYHYEIIDYRD